MPVKGALIDPFLPPGETLRQVESDGYGDGLHYGCTLFVDDVGPLLVRGQWREEGFTVEDAAEERLVHSPDMVADGRYAVWRSGAAVVVPCRNEQRGAALYSIALRTSGPEEGEVEEYKGAMVELLGAYSEAFVATLPCEGK